MSKQRPVNLDLTTISLPLPAIISILHRISGIILFALIPFLLYTLQTSLESADGFARVTAWFASPLVKLITFGSLAAILYHLLAGLRHIIMDMGYAETLSAARTTGTVTLVLAVTFTLILTGIWLW